MYANWEKKYGFHWFLTVCFIRMENWTARCTADDGAALVHDATNDMPRFLFLSLATKFTAIHVEFYGIVARTGDGLL